MEIRLKKGTRVKTDAETIYMEAEACMDAGGNLSLQTLVDRAKKKTAPLHVEFTWDNRVAGNLWRLQEARKLVQAVEVVHDSGTATRAFESVTVVKVSKETETETRRVFRSIEDIMADPIQRDELLAQAIKDAVAWRKRYARLQELAKVFAAIDEAVLRVA